MRLKRDEDDGAKKTAGTHEDINDGGVAEAIEGLEGLTGGGDDVETEKVGGTDESDQEERDLRRQSKMRDAQYKKKKDGAADGSRDDSPTPVGRKKSFVARNVFDQEIAAAQSAEGVDDGDESDDADEGAVVADAERAGDFDEIEGLDEQAKALAKDHPGGVAS